MNKTASELSLTPSVSYAFSKSGPEPTSWDIVATLLVNHGEYGGQRGKQIASGKGPQGTLKKTTEGWINEIGNLFDHEMVKELHGRLLILALCQIDEKLRDYLDRIGFLPALRDELLEDFDSLLLPEKAKEQAWRGYFLKKLNNKPLDGSKVRNIGFVAFVTGGPGLGDVAALCHRQRWNTSYTARYVLDSTQSIYEAIDLFIQDISAMDAAAAIGELKPSLATNADSWQKDILSFIGTEKPGLESIGIGRTDFLTTGKRLVLLVEYRRIPENIDLDKLGIHNLINSIHQLPERLCIVISGLPAKTQALFAKTLRSKDPGAPFLPLDLPKDLELARSQPLANDVPAGTDYLNLMGEVNAIAEAMTLKDMNPPLVVGILGGWGAGKSFILHLIKNRIQEIRCEPVDGPDDSSFPFIGHPYIINFDAWTYAKSNLWASLMQQIFIELDRQIGLEKMLQDELKQDLRKGQNTEIWRLLSDLSQDTRERLLKSDLGKKALEIVEKFKSGEVPETRLWNVLENLKKDELEKLKTAEENLEKTGVERDELTYQLKQRIEVQVEKEARGRAIKGLGVEMLQDAWKRLLKDKNEEDDPPSFNEVVGAISWFKQLKFESRTYIISLIIFALAALGISLLAKMDVWEKVSFTGLTALVGSVISGFIKFRKWSEEMRATFDESVNNHRRDPESVFESVVQLAPKPESAGNSPLSELDLPDDALLKKLASDKQVQEQSRRLSAIDDQYKEYQNKVVIIRQRIGMAARHRNLLDFVKQRLEGRTYEDKLGLLHQVKDDLEELSETLLDQRANDELFPRGKPRILLLIDDLDRCPPPKVVEVLEAAQLLVKTSLFVVVIAMDVRYVTRALEHEYAGVLTPHGEPSGLDYIEKIIQIPYRVRPATASGVKSFLQNQMKPKSDVVEEKPGAIQNVIAPAQSNIRASSASEFQQGEVSREIDLMEQKTKLRILPTDTIYFSKDEYEMMTQCCSVFDVSPRTMKRLVNVFKLFKIIWYRDKMGNGPADDIKRTMMALLVIAARYPEPMRDLLHLLERQFVLGELIIDKNVVQFLKAYCAENMKTSIVPQMWKEVSEALSNEQLVAQHLTFAELHQQHLHLVSSFSFVGENDPLRHVELQKNGPEPKSVPAHSEEKPVARKTTSNKKKVGAS